MARIGGDSETRIAARRAEDATSSGLRRPAKETVSPSESGGGNNSRKGAAGASDDFAGVAGWIGTGKRSPDSGRPTRGEMFVDRPSVDALCGRPRAPGGSAHTPKKRPKSRQPDPRSRPPRVDPRGAARDQIRGGARSRKTRLRIAASLRASPRDVGTAPTDVGRNSDFRQSGASVTEASRRTGPRRGAAQNSATSTRPGTRERERFPRGPRADSRTSRSPTEKPHSISPPAITDHRATFVLPWQT